MSKKDFKKYLGTVQVQYLNIKEDLKDFEEALKNNYITEDKLEDIKNEYQIIETNYQRLLYIDYLLELPRFKQNKLKERRAANRLKRQLSDEAIKQASVEGVTAENKEQLDKIKEQFINITNEESID